MNKNERSCIGILNHRENVGRAIKTELILWRVLFIILVLVGGCFAFLSIIAKDGVAVRESIKPLYKLSVVNSPDSSKCLETHILENALDGNAVDDYTAFENLNGNISFTLKLDEVLPVHKLYLDWSDEFSDTGKCVISLYNGGSLIKTLSESANPSSQTILLNEEDERLEIDTLKVEIKDIYQVKNVTLKQIALLPPPDSILEIIDNIEIKSSDSISQIRDKLKMMIQYVNCLLVYGLGPDDTDRNPDEIELLEYGEGHCGEYAYLLNKYLAMKGIECRTVDIVSRGQGGHSVVEARVKGQYFVLDPTLNLFFESSVQNLVEYGASDLEAPYIDYGWGDNYFLKNAYNTKYYMDVCDSYDFDFLQRGVYRVVSNMKEENLPSDMSVEMKESKKPFITFIFEEPIEFYRIKVVFGKTGYSGKMTVILDSEEQGTVIINDGLIWENNFRKKVSAKMITLELDAFNSVEPEMEELAVYR